VVLKGRFTGTYVMGHRTFKWLPKFELGVDLKPGTMGLWEHRSEKVDRVLQPILSALEAGFPAHLPSPELARRPGFELAQRRRKQVVAALGDDNHDEARKMASFAKYDDPQEAWDDHVTTGTDPLGDAWEEQPDPYDEEDAQAEFEAFSRAFKAYKRDPPKYRKRMKKILQLKRKEYRSDHLFGGIGGLERAATDLYILAQASGTPVGAVVAALREQPKRALSLLPLPGFPMPTRLRDRARFGKVFLSTWSVKKAVKALTPNIEGHIPISRRGAQDQLNKARYALIGVKSWPQIEMPDWFHRSFDNTLNVRSLSKEDVKKRVFFDVTRLGSDAKEVGMTAADFRRLIKKKGYAWVNHLLDLNMQVGRALGALAETVQGRRVIDYHRLHQWEELSRNGAFIETTYANLPRSARGSDPERAEAHHSRARHFVLPPGVTPLVKEEEFITEGRDLIHCVAGYFWHLSSWVFSFRTPDGCRATLELEARGTIKQFYGVRNTRAKASCQKLLKEFLRVNKENMKQMKLGQFPPPSAEVQKKGKKARRNSR